MTRTRLAAAPLASLAAHLLLSACASQAPTSTGFLNPPPPPAAAEHADTRRVQVATTFNPRAYDGWVLLPVVYTPGAVSAGKASDATRAELAKHLEASLAAAFDAKLPRRAAAGPRTLVVRASVTGIEAAEPVLNAVTTLAVFTPVTAGGASAELEVLDGATGQRLVAVSAADNGGFGLGFPVAYFQRHGHARRALARQAEELAKLATGTAQAAR
jgi:mRNA-degrading endonuclease toxin of MazEF toxin-antitoxin module